MYHIGQWNQTVQSNIAEEYNDDPANNGGLHPYLLVTMETGVNFLHIDGPLKHECVSRSTIGGGTYIAF
eukprot:1009693-Ditylum_brightwellii.AAC.1